MDKIKNKKNEGYQPYKSGSRGYQPISKATHRPKPPVSGSVIKTSRKVFA